MKPWAALGVAIITGTCGTLSLKAAQTQPWWFVVVVVGNLAAFAALSLSLRWGMGLGVGYGVWGAAGVALTALASAALFGEPLTTMMVAGMVLIMAGVLLVELGSHSARGSARQEVAG